jgi:hypothetical protein
MDFNTILNFKPFYECPCFLLVRFYGCEMTLSKIFLVYFRKEPPVVLVDFMT